MIEYTITHTFDQFRPNFSNWKGKKREKTHFFQQQTALFFFKNNEKWPFSRPFNRHIACKDWTIFTDFEKNGEKSAFLLFFDPCGWKKLI